MGGEGQNVLGRLRKHFCEQFAMVLPDFSYAGFDEYEYHDPYVYPESSSKQMPPSDLYLFVQSGLALSVPLSTRHMPGRAINVRIG